jgi:hypothetical protein
MPNKIKSTHLVFERINAHNLKFVFSGSKEMVDKFVENNNTKKYQIRPMNKYEKMSYNGCKRSIQ